MLSFMLKKNPRILYSKLPKGPFGNFEYKMRGFFLSIKDNIIFCSTYVAKRKKAVIIEPNNFPLQTDTCL